MSFVFLGNFKGAIVCHWTLDIVYLIGPLKEYEIFGHSEVVLLLLPIFVT